MIKKILFIAIACCLTNWAIAQSVSPKIASSDQELVANNYDKPAGPDYNWDAYLVETMKYPKEAYTNGIQGRVVVRFNVEEDGSLTGIEVVKNKEIGYGIPEEAVRVLKIAKKWQPAIKDGQPVSSFITLPITFRLQK
ncbi:MAG TPA: energy transducer TonB [Edaphocola sp.]|nr:energy transducer TonB [Edaphocola sp.]